jgi:IMP dehydrogenase
MIERGLDYKDIHLLPHEVSSFSSRDDVSTETIFCGEKLDFGILSAPMPDVSDGNFCAELSKFGGLGFIHRFQDIQTQVADYMHNVRHGSPWYRSAGCAIGINGDYKERYQELYKNSCRIFLIDVANGANTNIAKVVSELYALGDIYIIAGNIASREGLKFLNDIGVYAARVGIAGGSVCSTKIATGIYTPMFSTLRHLYNYKINNNFQIKIIADGGIKTPADYCKAMCVADIAMAGGIFAGTDESPGNIIKNDGKLCKVFRGAASYGVQKYEAGKEPKYVEGLETLIEYKGSLKSVVDSFNNGLRSCLSYMNAKNVDELKTKYNFVTT